MKMSRKDFIKKGCHYGCLGLLYLAAGPLLLQGCRKAGEQPDKEEPFAPEKSVLWPAYAALGVEALKLRAEQAYAIMESCSLCPRNCGINRLDGETGFCRAPDEAVVYSHQPHFGEELPLVGGGGSGTIFFSNCNLRCVFCQNWPIAHEGRGRLTSDEDLAAMMLDLQGRGCHNINLVTPTHVLPNILGAAAIACEKGLKVPLCYNTSGYEKVEALGLLDGVIDIYLPDYKFMDGEEAERYNLAHAYDYPAFTAEAILKMQRQVGTLRTDERGIAERGLMIRHLVMPNGVSGTRQFVDWVAEKLPLDTYLNIMAQYRVEFLAFEYEEIARAITLEEYIEAMQWAMEAGLSNLDERSLTQYERFLETAG